jgi:hypothetical protein
LAESDISHVGRLEVSGTLRAATIASSTSTLEIQSSTLTSSGLLTPAGGTLTVAGQFSSTGLATLSAGVDLRNGDLVGET